MDKTFKSRDLQGKERCTKRRDRNLSLERGKKAGNVYEKASLIKGVIKESLKTKTFDDKAVYDELLEKFLDMGYPTEATAKAHAYDAYRQCARYVKSELDLLATGKRKVSSFTPVKVLDINGICNVEVRPDFVFRGKKEFRRKTYNAKGRVEYYTVEEPYLEVVKIRCCAPDITQSGKKQDEGVNQSLELYSMLRYARTLLDPKKDGGINVGASYYFLRKKGDSNKFSYEFFDTKGAGNIVTLWEKNDFFEPIVTDNLFIPQLTEYVKGDEGCDPKYCDTCEFSCSCNYTRPPKYIEEVETKKSIADLELTDQQEMAIGFRKGIARINAGAGAGKTLVSALRVAFMLDEGIPPEDICMLTFTNTGAEEMRERVRLYAEDIGCDADVSKLTSMTFHSFGNLIVQKNYQMFGFTEPPILVDDVERLSIIAKLLKENFIEGLNYKDFLLNFPFVKGALHTASHAFTLIKEERLSKGEDDEEKFRRMMHEDGYPVPNDESFYEQIVDLYTEFNSVLMEKNLLEYADQELMILELLDQNPFYFEDYGFRHVMVDEFQDTNRRQFEILMSLIDTPDFESFMVVGDDSQSIFGFRGSTPEFIINFFDNVGKPGEDFYLLENHRSTPEIIDFANKLNALNVNRVEKDLIATRPHGAEVIVKQFWKKEDETNYILDELQKKVAEGVGYEDIAYIASRRDELLKMGAACTERGIPWVMLNPEPVLQNSRVSAAVALARFFRDQSASKDAFEYLNAKADNKLLETMTDEEIKKEMLILEGLVRVIISINDYNAFLDMIDELDDDDEIFQGFRDSVKRYKSLDGALDYIVDYDKYGEGVAIKRGRKYPGVVLTTAHSSKGKEWPIVFNAISKYHDKNHRNAIMEEKRRLLFVSSTRARDELIITGQSVAFGTKKDPVYNRFLQDSFACVGKTFSTVNPYDQPKIKSKKKN